MKTLPWWVWPVTVAVLALAVGAGVLVGRGMSEGGEPDLAVTEQTTGATEPATTSDSGEAPDSKAMGTLRVYLARGEHLGLITRQVPETQAVATAALQQLLAGPTAQEQRWGLSTQVPAGTELLGLAIKDGTAMVDLSSEFAAEGGMLGATMRLAQVVYTLTQFSTVQRVTFLIEGQPVETFTGEGIMLDQPQVRSGYEYVLPAIFVEGPAPGASVTSPIRVWGTANTFEASFMVRVESADGSVVTEVPAMASSGTGTRGTFDMTLLAPNAFAGPATLVFYESSAKDGSEINVVRIPIIKAP